MYEWNPPALPTWALPDGEGMPKQTKKLNVTETIHPDEIPNSGKDDYAQHIQLEPKQKLSEAKISDIQAGTINDLLLESGTDPAVFMAHYEIKTINDLPLIKFEPAMTKLKVKTRLQSAGPWLW
jgi:hypothetical protein